MFYSRKGLQTKILRGHLIVTTRKFSPLTSAEACEKNFLWVWKESCVSTGVRKPGNTCESSTAMIWL